jgi:hypothetical protein
MKNGQEIAAENAETLRKWLAAHAAELPYLADGTLNKSAIARAAGLDRQIFVSNPKAKALLAEYGRPSHQPHRPQHLATAAVEILHQKDTEISRLRDLLAQRELELTKLRQEVQAARKLKAMHDVMVETMRHVKQSPDP